MVHTNLGNLIRRQFIQDELTEKFNLTKGIKDKKQLALPASALPLVPGCRKLLPWAMPGSNGLFDAVDCIHLFPTKYHNRKIVATKG